MDEVGKRHEEELLSREKMRRGETSESQLEPSSSSGLPNRAQPGGSTEGMAVAAFPPTAPKSETRREKSDPPSGLEDILRKVSTAYFEKEKRLGDSAELPKPEEGEKAERPATKPGTLLNIQFEGDFNRKRTSYQSAGETREPRAVETENDESPGGKMRKMTARRKGQVDESNEGSSDGSWGEIKSHLSRKPKNAPEDDLEPRRTQKRASPDSAISPKKRARSRNSHSSHESDAAGRRATDLFGRSKNKYKNEHSRDLPSCLRQTFPRATDPPLSSKYDPTLLPDSTRENGDMDKVAVDILNLQGGKEGSVEIDHSKAAGETIFALRGFG